VGLKTQAAKGSKPLAALVSSGPSGALADTAEASMAVSKRVPNSSRTGIGESG